MLAVREGATVPHKHGKEILDRYLFSLARRHGIGYLKAHSRHGGLVISAMGMRVSESPVRSSLDLVGRPSGRVVLDRIRARSRDKSEKGCWFEQLFMRIALQQSFVDFPVLSCRID